MISASAISTIDVKVLPSNIVVSRLVKATNVFNKRREPVYHSVYENQHMLIIICVSKLFDVNMAGKLFDSPDMRETIRRLIRARMAYKGFEYKDLAERLEALGVHQAESNLRSKVNNGSLGAQLFVYILLALDMSALEMSEIQELLADVTASHEPEEASD
jgi:hypothetical protein